MSWLVSAKQYIPAVIGEPFGGGYFAGYISHTANGQPTHALIVAPAATGATGTGYTLTANLAWKTSSTTTPGTTSDFDGAANTSAIVAAGIADHPAAQFCTGLNIGGFTDWYLPARYELDIAYFNLKPGTGGNSSSSGTNVYAVPQRNTNWTPDYPTQTTVSLFTFGQAQAFTTAGHFSSTESSVANAWEINFNIGNQVLRTKTATFPRVRAFRRIAL